MNAPQGIAAIPTAQPQPGMAPPMQGAQQPQPDPTAPQANGQVPDYVKLIIASQAAKLKEAAQREMALQQQQQPTVAQQIAQQAQVQQAPAPQQQAPQPPQGIARAAQGGMIERGGVDRLPSNLRMASGGIVNFEEGGVTKGYDPAEWDSYEEYLAAKRKQQDSQQVSPLEAVSRIRKLIRSKIGLDNEEEMPQSSRSTGGNPDPVPQQAEPDMNQIAQARVQRQQGTPVLPKPPVATPKPPATGIAASPAVQNKSSAAVSTTSGPSDTATEKLSDVRVALEKKMMEQMQSNPDRTRDEQMAWALQALGVDAKRLADLKRQADREAADQNIAAQRESEGMRALRAASQRKGQWGETGAHAIQGIAGALNQARAQTEGFATQDRDMLAKRQELARADDATDTAMRTTGVNAGSKARTEAVNSGDNAARNLTSLIGVDEQVAQRREAALLRAQSLKMQLAEMSQRARDRAQDRGDQKVGMQLTALEKAAQAEGGARARAEAKQMGNMDMTDINTSASLYAAQILHDNPRYIALLASQGIELPKAGKGAGTPLPPGVKVTPVK